MRRTAIAAVVATLVMISLGGLVTSRDAGLSIPDGVSNHGALFPLEQVRDGYVNPEGRQYKGGEVLTELLHRYWGWLLGLGILQLAVTSSRLGKGEPARKLAWGAAALVALQGAIGAAGVVLKQPSGLVVPHAMLAQALLAVLVAIVSLTAPRRGAGSAATGGDLREGAVRSVFHGTLALAVLTYAQTLFGSAYRHVDAIAALAIHLVIGLTIVLLTAGVVTRIQTWRSTLPSLARFATAQATLLMVQLFLGFLAWLFRRPKNTAGDRPLETLLFPTLHVLTGALLFSGFVWLTFETGKLFSEIHARSAERSPVETLAPHALRS